MLLASRYHTLRVGVTWRRVNVTDSESGKWQSRLVYCWLGRSLYPLPGPRGAVSSGTVLSLLHWLKPSYGMASSVSALCSRLPIGSRGSCACSEEAAAISFLHGKPLLKENQCPVTGCGMASPCDSGGYVLVC